ncbi:ABC transporter permease [Actinomadura atramentaria]|uniref:ABC transporter permease n=1 Tax=Actinomadura atramentaria TaxID=1990 RepID=UPI0003787CD1|nr:ABC transporter permease [Actinomadura atramentaria]
MNSTIAMITYRAMLGRRRALLLFVLPLLLLVLAAVLRVTGNADLDTTTNVLAVAVSTLLPLLALIAGTGVIGPEIDDGQIMYVLTKPISRTSVLVTKLAVAFSLVVAFAVVPGLLAGLIMSGTTAGVAPAFGAALLVGAAAYTPIFTALAVASRNAVTIGLLYALVWETLFSGLAPGAGAVSVQQWSLAVADALTSAHQVDSTVSLGAAIPLLLVAAVGGTFLGAARLRTLTIAGAE